MGGHVLRLFARRRRRGPFRAPPRRRAAPRPQAEGGDGAPRSEGAQPTGAGGQLPRPHCRRRVGEAGWDGRDGIASLFAFCVLFVWLGLIPFPAVLVFCFSWVDSFWLCVCVCCPGLPCLLLFVCKTVWSWVFGRGHWIHFRLGREMSDAVSTFPRCFSRVTWYPPGTWQWVESFHRVEFFTIRLLFVCYFITRNVSRTSTNHQQIVSTSWQPAGRTGAGAACRNAGRQRPAGARFVYCAQHAARWPRFETVGVDQLNAPGPSGTRGAGLEQLLLAPLVGVLPWLTAFLLRSLCHTG